jgi:arylsulfatase A
MLKSTAWYRWLAIVFFSTVLLGHAAELPVKPNVIVIVTDDQGAMDVGCYGAKDLVTPNMDALAARGVRFTQFYAAAPVCSPSRAALLTGRYPLRAGLTGNAASQPEAKGEMPGAQLTMAEMFKAAGYATAHIGKWHLGYTRETMPNAQGFDHSFGHMGGCIDNYSHFFFWAGPNRHDLFRNGVEVDYTGRYFPDLMVEEATQFIDRNRTQPFFMYFAINLPHYPYQGDAKWLERFKGLPYPRNLYAAFLASCDERIGMLLKRVDELGMRERTIVVFQSDNGHSKEDRAHFGGGSAGPYRGEKFSLFEGGIRLPAIISWPGKLPQGEVRGQMVHGCDWMPTLASLCGVKLLSNDIDGKDITPVIRSATTPSPHTDLHWYVGGGKQAQWAVRQDQWKLIGNVQYSANTNLTAQDKAIFLSDLTTDVSERTNFASAHPEIVQRLRAMHEDWVSVNKKWLPAEGTVQDKKGNEK